MVLTLNRVQHTQEQDTIVYVHIKIITKEVMCLFYVDEIRKLANVSNKLIATGFKLPANLSGSLPTRNKKRRKNVK